MKLSEFFTKYIVIKCTKFGQEAFRFNISTIHCLDGYFWTQCSCHSRCIGVIVNGVLHADGDKKCDLFSVVGYTLEMLQDMRQILLTCVVCGQELSCVTNPLLFTVLEYVGGVVAFSG